MTTDEEKIPGENYFEWEVKPPDGSTPKEIEFYATLRSLLDPYIPVETFIESTHQFTTNELLQAIEQHYAIPQGESEVFGIEGEKLVDYLVANGWICKNTGGLQLEWLMRKK